MVNAPMKVLIVLHPLEKFGPNSSGAISVIARQLSLTTTAISVLGLDHEFDKYVVHNQFFVKPLRVASWLVRLVFDGLRLPYRGQPALLLGTFWYLWKHRFKGVVFFNDAKSARLVATWFKSVVVCVWYQNVPEDAFELAAISTCSNVRLFGCSDYISRKVQALCAKDAIVSASTVKSAAEHFEVTSEPTGAIRLLFVGRLDPGKGVDFCIDLLSELIQREVECSLTIVGGLWFYPGAETAPSNYDNELRKRAEGLPVTFTGHVNHDVIREIYMTSDIQLVPSKVPEPAGLVAIEGLVSGCYVVSSNLGGLPEYVDGFGYVVQGFDVLRWADVVVELVHDGKLRSNRQSRMDRARNAYSWEKTCQLLEEKMCHH
jgi:glycosyltransferase involved in cell wall biosynthesis